MRRDMSQRGHYYIQADFCKSMADKASSVESHERWLTLAAKWLALADETYGDGVIQEFATGADRMRSRG